MSVGVAVPLDPPVTGTWPDFFSTGNFALPLLFLPSSDMLLPGAVLCGAPSEGFPGWMNQG